MRQQRYDNVLERTIIDGCKLRTGFRFIHKSDEFLRVKGSI